MASIPQTGKYTAFEHPETVAFRKLTGTSTILQVEGSTTYLAQPFKQIKLVRKKDEDHGEGNLDTYEISKKIVKTDQLYVITIKLKKASQDIQDFAKNYGFKATSATEITMETNNFKVFEESVYKHLGTQFLPEKDSGFLRAILTAEPSKAQLMEARLKQQLGQQEQVEVTRDLK